MIMNGGGGGINSTRGKSFSPLPNQPLLVPLNIMPQSWNNPVLRFMVCCYFSTQSTSHEDVVKAVEEFVVTFEPPLVPALQGGSFETQISIADDPPDYESANRVLKVSLCGCTCLCVHRCLCVCTCLCVRVGLCVRTCLCVRMCLCGCTCLCVHMCLSTVSVCLYIRTYVLKFWKMV